ncbi:MAG: hypothetical protein ACI4LM_07480, partial [Anaerovoracaceae bacterium]
MKKRFMGFNNNYMETNRKRSWMYWIRLIFLTAILCLSVVLVIQNNYLVRSGVLKTGDKVRLEGKWRSSGDSCVCTIPDELPEDAVLSVIHLGNDVKVYVDDELIFSSTGNPSNVRTNDDCIDLPDNCEGRELRVTCGDSLRSTLTQLNEHSFIGTRDALILHILYRNLYALLFACYSVALSLFIFAIEFRLSGGGVTNREAAINVALFVLCGGLWCLTDSQILQLFTEKTGIVAMISVIAFLLLPVFLLRYIDALLKEKNLYMIETIFILTGFVILLLHAVGLVSVYKTVTVVHILAFIVMPVVIYDLVREWKKSRSNEVRKVVSGCVIFFVCEGAAIIAYYMKSSSRLYSEIFSAGILMISLSFVSVFIDQYYGLLGKDFESRVYRRLAYSDIMTGLKNRTAYNRWIKNRVLKKGTAIVMIDINDLKARNDNY